MDPPATRQGGGQAGPDPVPVSPRFPGGDVNFAFHSKKKQKTPWPSHRSPWKPNVRAKGAADAGTMRMRETGRARTARREGAGSAVTQARTDGRTDGRADRQTRQSGLSAEPSSAR